MGILFSTTSMRLVLLSLALLLISSFLVSVDSRCMPSPSVEELFESEDYVIRAFIESEYDNKDGEICNSEQAQPVLATILEVFKGSNAPDGIYPKVGDQILLNY